MTSTVTPKPTTDVVVTTSAGGSATFEESRTRLLAFCTHGLVPHAGVALRCVEEGAASQRDGRGPGVGSGVETEAAPQLDGAAPSGGGAPAAGARFCG